MKYIVLIGIVAAVLYMLIWAERMFIKAEKQHKQ